MIHDQHLREGDCALLHLCPDIFGVLLVLDGKECLLLALDGLLTWQLREEGEEL